MQKTQQSAVTFEFVFGENSARKSRDYRDVIILEKLSGEQGWRSGESARLPPMCLGFDSRTWRHMWAEFVGSLLCYKRFFSGNSGFPLFSKTNI